jgi:hypothetical protein
MRIINLDGAERSHSRSVGDAAAHFKCGRMVSKASRKQKKFIPIPEIEHQSLELISVTLLFE